MACSSDPASVAVVTKQESVKSESRHTLSLLQSNGDRSSLAATTHGRPLGGVIDELDTKRIREAQHFVDERLSITRKIRGVMVSAQDKQNQYADQIGRKNHEHFRVGDKVLKIYLNMQFQYYAVVLPNYCHDLSGLSLW